MKKWEQIAREVVPSAREYTESEVNLVAEVLKFARSRGALSDNEVDEFIEDVEKAVIRRFSN